MTRVDIIKLQSTVGDPPYTYIVCNISRLTGKRSGEPGVRNHVVMYDGHCYYSNSVEVFHSLQLKLH